MEAQTKEQGEINYRLGMCMNIHVVLMIELLYVHTMYPLDISKIE